MIDIEEQIDRLLSKLEEEVKDSVSSGDTDKIIRLRRTLRSLIDRWLYDYELLTKLYNELSGALVAIWAGERE